MKMRRKALGYRRSAQAISTKLSGFILIFSLIFTLSGGCSHSGTEKNGIAKFYDNTTAYTGVSLFTFLNPFPVVKSFFTNLDPVGFNKALGDSLAKAPQPDNLGTLRATEAMMIQSRPAMQTLASGGADLINKIQTNNPGAYAAVQPIIEKIRHYPSPVVRNLIPITAQALLDEYNSNSNLQIQQSITTTANDLKKQTTINFLQKAEDFLYKALTANANFRSGVQGLMNGFFAPSAVNDPTHALKNGFINIVYGAGDMMNFQAGFMNQTSPATTLKQLILNLVKYFTVAVPGQSTTYSTNAAYNAPGGTLHSSELGVLFTDFFQVVRDLVVPSKNAALGAGYNGIDFLKDSATNLNALGFPTTLLASSQSGSGPIEQSLGNLIRVDGNGFDRAYNANSGTVSALETLFLILYLADNYGYTWNPSVTTNDWITGMTGGEITLGDGLFAMMSVISSSDSFNFKNISEQSRTSNNVYRDGSVYQIGMNSRVLSLMEDASRGATQVPSTNPIDLSATAGPYDKVFNKTLPWMLDWLVKVTYKGYGPYYNVNRRDGAGNYLSPDGSIARNSDLSENNYKPTWKTHRYDIQLNPNSTNKCISLGGYNSATTCATPNGTAGAGQYTIPEIAKTDAQRAVSSDEEAFYKNLQWLLYEKRFVVVLPVRAKLAATVAFAEALFVTAVGNGLVGMLNLNANCGPLATASSGTCGNYNGQWRSTTGNSPDTTKMLKVYSAVHQDLQYFSSVPGDSAMLVEGWGYGADGTGVPASSGNMGPTVVYSALWSLLVPQPTISYGLIPPVISQNGYVLQLLGFLPATSTDTSSSINTATTSPAPVTPDLFNANDTVYWPYRNRFTPFVAALAKSVLDKVSGQTTATPQNPVTILSRLAELLSRPYAFYGPDTTNGTVTNPTPPSIYQIRINGITYGLRNPSGGVSDYQPDDTFRSFLSILTENTRRFQDGMLNLISKTRLVSGLAQFLAQLGDASHADSFALIAPALENIMGETLLISECAGATDDTSFQTLCPTKFDIQGGVIYWFRDHIVEYPNPQLFCNPDPTFVCGGGSTYFAPRSANIYDSTWDDVGNFANNIRDYMSSSSGWSVVKSLDFLLDLLINIQPSYADIQNTLDLLASLFNHPNHTGTYTVTNLLTQSLPPVLTAIAPYGKNLYGTGYYLAVPGAFFSYLETNAYMDPNFAVTDLFQDFKTLLNSQLIQTQAYDNTSFLYSAGTLIGELADIYQNGRKFSPEGYYFYDNWNSGQPTSTYFDDLNVMFSLR
ncbi:hypothetical protein LEP1GSC058_2386 [Leptospira fainei serovar Hurstbridge str. BUT 6]|uniref:Uncharacterized protein n=2 Tax=Leptospira fainei TaxID=48782 RepID=S3USC1_9LEPT|nr:hypothetical protein LEP1GSC058_2386 [Leptospira fainei serovar Hurstbridge str. BUT 6]